MPYKDIEKQRAAQRRSHRRKRAYFIKKYGGKCVKCGSKRKLEFDHKDRRTRRTRRTIWVMSRTRLTKELKKCQLLCKRCHIDKTHDERGDRVLVHGTLYRGYQRKCRCILCRSANAAYERNRRRKLRGKVRT